MTFEYFFFLFPPFILGGKLENVGRLSCTSLSVLGGNVVC